MGSHSSEVYAYTVRSHVSISIHGILHPTNSNEEPRRFYERVSVSSMSAIFAMESSSYNLYI